MTYKFRLYPNNEQIQTLDETIEACRLLYNQSLEERNKYHLSRFDQCKRLKEKQFGIPAQLKQYVLFRLERAFKNYHRDRCMGYPSFKRKGRYNSFTYPHCGFKIKENKLVLSKIGSIKMIMHRIPVGTIKTCTIIRDIDKWFVCFAVDVIRIKNNAVPTVGIDVGVKNWMTLSTGEIIDGPRLNKSITKIKQLQRNLSRKKKGSHNRHKARLILAKAWKKIKLQREDYLHKITSILAARYGCIFIEKLNTKVTKRKRGRQNINRSILNRSFHMIKRLAAYKAEVVEVDATNNTQTCSQCGDIGAKKDLFVRVFSCPKCGLE